MCNFTQGNPILEGFYIFKKFFMEAYLTYNIILVSGVQSNDSIFVCIVK